MRVINKKGNGSLVSSIKANSMEFRDCSTEYQNLIMEIMMILKGNTLIASKEVLEVCLKEIEYFSIL